MIPDSLKIPRPTQELTILRQLLIRMGLPNNFKLKVERLTKGYAGEKKFFGLLRKSLPPNVMILNNLLLKWNDSVFQLDSLLIFENNIFIFEVKNFEGDFFIRDEKWFTVNNENEISNPLLQIERSTYLLRKLLQQLGHKFTVTSYLAFINNEFTLYHAPLDKNIILPTQLNRFIKNLSTISFKRMKQHQVLVNQLASRHLNISTHQQIPKYDYDDLKKGVICNNCYSFLFPLSRHYLKCKSCKQKVTVESAIIQSVNEFNLLFPDRKITTSAIHEWCKVIKSKNAIRRVLSKHYKKVGKRRHTYYVIPL